VHTTGGGTWLSEFAFLSGFDWRTFGRGGAFAPVSLAPRLQHSLPRLLRSLGYRTVVVSAVGADFLRARQAYAQYGFEEFYASQDLGFSSDWLQVTDAQVFDTALATVARSEDPRPLFLFILTIRNHGPHGETDRGIPATLKREEEAYGWPLADYLGRLAESARAFDALRERWLATPRPRVIGWFGDHQPELTRDFLDAESELSRTHSARNVGPAQRRYLTYYQLAANFGPGGAHASDTALDIPFLPTELLRFAGLPLDADNSAAAQVQSNCGGLLVGCPDHGLVDDYLSYRIHELQAVR
jgi:phosphoglycerol transferase MdoB-like AlkP superfamily enzyme